MNFQEPYFYSLTPATSHSTEISHLRIRGPKFQSNFDPPQRHSRNFGHVEFNFEFHFIPYSIRSGPLQNGNLDRLEYYRKSSIVVSLLEGIHDDKGMENRTVQNLFD